MALTGINEARANLSVASNNYAKIQRELDKYNKLFQTYAFASPETQIRAASVMRQALNEYNSLKAQQENNALRIYQAQNLVDYYNNNTPAGVELNSVSQPAATELNTFSPGVEIDTGTYQEEPAIEVVPVIDNTVPGSSNIAYATSTQSTINDDILNNTQTVKYLNNLTNQNKIKYSATPVSAQKIVSSQTSKYPNTSMTQATTQWTKNIRYNPYGQGNVNIGNISKINSGSSLVSTGQRFGINRQRRFK